MSVTDKLIPPNKRNRYLKDYMYHPAMLSRLYYPTQGYPRKPRLVGKLITKNEDSTKDQRYHFLHLFEREVIRDREFQYYAAEGDSDSELKFEVHNPRKKELYNNDEVTVEDLGEYTVKLHKDYDYPYTPLII